MKEAKVRGGEEQIWEEEGGQGTTGMESAREWGCGKGNRNEQGTEQERRKKRKERKLQKMKE